MATIIYPDGRETELRPADGRAFTISELSQVIGGPVHTIPTRDGRKMFFLRSTVLPRNRKATGLTNLTRAYIHGDAVICTNDELRK